MRSLFHTFYNSQMESIYSGGLGSQKNSHFRGFQCPGALLVVLSARNLDSSVIEKPLKASCFINMITILNRLIGILS